MANNQLIWVIIVVVILVIWWCFSRTEGLDLGEESKCCCHGPWWPTGIMTPAKCKSFNNKCAPVEECDSCCCSSGEKRMKKIDCKLKWGGKCLDSSECDNVCCKTSSGTSTTSKIDCIKNKKGILVNKKNCQCCCTTCSTGWGCRSSTSDKSECTSDGWFSQPGNSASCWYSGPCRP